LLKTNFAVIDFKELHALKAEILQVVEQKRSYLGQMDVNASSPVWDFYEETLKSLEVMAVIYSV
jgi:sucrose phosphorylase